MPRSKDADTAKSSSTAQGNVPLEFKVEDLCQNPHWISVISKWHHSEWAKLHTNLSAAEWAKKLEERERLLHRHLNSEPLPSTFVAHINNSPIATVSLVYYQFTGQRLPSEWLTNLYVEPRFRRQGVASQLLKCAIKHAQTVKLPRLLLYTSDRGPFYRARQWQLVNTGIVQGQQVEILEYKLQ